MDSNAQNDPKCHFCLKRSESRDYSMARQARNQKRVDFSFREIFTSKGGNLKRAEKEETIELALPGAFSLDSDDSPRIQAAFEQEAMVRYAKLGPNCVRFLGLHRILPSTKDPKHLDFPQNFALVAIGTRSNPYPEFWSSNGAFCEEHMMQASGPLNGAGDKFRSYKDFQSFSCELCHKKGSHPTASSNSKPISTNVHRQISKRASLRLMLLNEKPPQEEHFCSYLEQNFFFRWKCVSDSSAPALGPKTGITEIHSSHLRSVTQLDTDADPSNWMDLLQKRFHRICNSSPDLQGYSSSVMPQAINELNSLKLQHPYMNPTFGEDLKKCIVKAIDRAIQSLPFPNPNWIALKDLHADIISTDIAQFFLKRHHHILSLDQLKIGTGFFECEAVNKQLLLDCSQAHITVKKMSKLNATFTDQNGQQILPSIELIGISDNWLYAAGDPYLRCNDCNCDKGTLNRTVVIIEQKLANQEKFYQKDKWVGMQVRATINNMPFHSEVAGFDTGNRVKLTKGIPENASDFVLFFEYPLHKLAGNLRVKFDNGDSASKAPIMIMQALQSGDYGLPQALPSPNLFSIVAIFSSKPDASLSAQQFWKFRISRISAHPVPAFHHFWGRCPKLAQPWKSAHYEARSNHYCIVPPQGNCIIQLQEEEEGEGLGAAPPVIPNQKVGKCFHFINPTEDECHCSHRVSCSVCRRPAESGWVPSRHDLCNDFISLVDCVTDLGQSRWSLHFELDSMAAPSHHSYQPQGGVMFVYIPANLGKVQKHRPEVLGFVGTSSPVLSMDIIDRTRSHKTVFSNGFRETFESILVSCLDGRICVVNSPRVPSVESLSAFESPEAPSHYQQKISDQFRSVECLKGYLKEQLQDSSQQHALFNGCVIDYLLRFDSGSLSSLRNDGASLKSVICNPGFFTPDAKAQNFKCGDVIKYLQHSLSRDSKPSEAQQQSVCQTIATAHKKTSLEQQLLRTFLKPNVGSDVVSKATQQARDSLMNSLSSQKNSIVENKISKAFVDCLLEIYRLQQSKLGMLPKITALNFLACRHDILAQATPQHKRDFIEMLDALSYVRKTVIRSLGYQNSTVDLSRAELHFLQAIRDDYDPFQSPSVSTQMVLELLTPVSGLNRLHTHARSVHFVGSFEDGSFHILAEICQKKIRNGSLVYSSHIYSYSFRIPSLQSRSCSDFLSAWLPQHSSFFKIHKNQKSSGWQTKCPHGLFTGDFVRFRDPSNPLQNAPVCKVRVNEADLYSFEVDSMPSGYSPTEGSFVQLQPRFCPFQKLDLVTTCLSDRKSQVKCLILRKKPNPSNLRQAAWIEIMPSTGGDIPNSGLCIWSTDGLQRFLIPNERRITSVECACFLPCETEVIALGCRLQNNQNQLCIFARDRDHERFAFADVQDPLPSLTSLRLLPADDAADLSRSDSFILVAATKLTEFNQSAFFLHVTKEHTSPPNFKVKCFRSINEIRATSSTSKKPIASIPLRATYPTFKSIDVVPIRSKAHNNEDSWLYFNDFSTKYLAKVHEPNKPFELLQFEKDGNFYHQWPVENRIRLLDSLKAERHFVQFLRPSNISVNISVFFDSTLRHKLFSIDTKNRGSEKASDSSFLVTTGSPTGILSQFPSDDHPLYPFQVVVPSDLDGEYGHDSGIAKFAFLLDSPSACGNPVAADSQFRGKTRLFAVPLRSWFPRLVQGKFGNSLQ